ncbi:MAG: zinc dependent phospholipase C family protein [Sarcina sp.]
MMANTHLAIARHLYYNLGGIEQDLISYNNFLYGNIKPDMVSKYKLKKHYMDESFTMVIDKIKALSSLSDNELNKSTATIRFSQELGVICHFLCDFFCIPHSERWEFKHSMNKHVKYEKELAAYAKTFNLPSDSTKVFGYYNITEFILKNHRMYKKANSYENDLMFATYVCASVIHYIVDSIKFNSSIDFNRVDNKKYSYKR